MSSTLDLEGGILIVPSDTAESYYQVTDSVGGGSLVMQAGASLIFDDAAGAGFVQSAAFSISILGTAEAPCVIRSESTAPAHRWTLPTAQSMQATRATFSGFVGEQGSAWTLNNVALLGAVPLSPMLPALKRLMTQRCTVERFAGYDPDGGERYDAPRTVACRSDGRRSVIADGNGTVHGIETTLYIPGDEQISDKDRFTVDDIPGRAARASRVRACYDLAGRLTHWEVSI